MVLVSILAIPTLLVSILYLSHQWVNLTFARSLFSNEPITISRVIGSKRWHYWSEGPFACTYAIVELDKQSNDALGAAPPAILGTLCNTDGSDNYMWPQHASHWKQTPISDFNDFMCKYPSRKCCLSDLSISDAQKVIAGFHEKNGWVVFSGEVTAFVLLNHRIVGTIRYGD